MFVLVYVSVPRVSTDGQPHEILTLVTCVSGLLIATIIVSIIVMALRRVHHNEKHRTKTILLSSAPPPPPKTDVEAQPVPKLILSDAERPKIKIFTIFGSSKQSFDLNS